MISSLFLRIEAPFAAYRWMQAGVYRGTFPVIPHSAAWGLALNLAAIETRGPLDEVVTRIRADAPVLDIAVGQCGVPQRSTLYQQLHGYPVGASGKELKSRVHGQKYWIAPVKRELLVGMKCVVGVRGDPEILERIRPGLAGTLAATRYGLPFAGDNQFLFDRIDVCDAPVAQWLLPVAPGAAPHDSTRLTTNIDRVSSSRTESPVFSPSDERECPDEAWISIGPRASVAT